jgi:hypothetical protein
VETFVLYLVPRLGGFHMGHIHPRCIGDKESRQLHLEPEGVSAHPDPGQEATVPPLFRAVV